MSKINRFLTGLGLTSLATAVVWLFINRRLFTVSDVITGQSPDYPELRAHIYYASPSESLEIAEQAIDANPRWRVIAFDRESNVLYAETESAFGDFLNDLTVMAQSFGDRHTRVIIRSKSRIDYKGGDCGENARNIRFLQDVMDEQLVGG